jgi:predicted CXXCH cytochrome family protein
MRRTLPFLILLFAGAGESTGMDISTTKHNLSVLGLDSMSRICVFCHVPHNASPVAPLWNRDQRSNTYQTYSSSTSDASVGQPTGSSKLCLSCHDGTVAMGQVFNPDPRISRGGTLSGRANLTTDLSDDHPVSFPYNSQVASQDSELAHPSDLTGSPVQLDSSGQLQCTSCHDPHESRFPKFLVVDNTRSGLCVTCHTKPYWFNSVHATSGRGWNSSGVDPWPNTDFTTVATNGCENCHTPHGAGAAARLHTYTAEEDGCFVCHGGNVTVKDVQSDFGLPYRHPVADYSGVHDPLEDTPFMARHIECSDCHNPHAATHANPTRGAAGITIDGAPAPEASALYEVCFRCHADGVNVPAPSIARRILQNNIRLKFALGNPSFHPVAGPGQNPDSPSLRPPLTETSVIGCDECHRPHGSGWPYLFVQEYRTADNTAEGNQAYALCYQCHDRTSILGDRSFGEHQKHISGERTPCSACHDPHGISATQGNSTNNTHLINFDVSIVQAVPETGRLEFVDLGSGQGSCYLLCHGELHNPLSY